MVGNQGETEVLPGGVRSGERTLPFCCLGVHREGRQWEPTGFTTKGIMTPYASRTGTRTTLAALKAAGWGLLVSATGVQSREGFDVWCLDNGAWTAHQKGTEWNADLFVKLCHKLGDGAQFVVVPDIVGGGLDSLQLSLSWLPRLDHVAQRRLIAVQDGMVPNDVRQYLNKRVGIFVGGSTEWKLETLRSWGCLARETGAYLHVGRVNSQRRIALCQDAGADSFDGTSVTCFPKTLKTLDVAVRQQCLFGGIE